MATGVTDSNIATAAAAIATDADNEMQRTAITVGLDSSVAMEQRLTGGGASSKIGHGNNTTASTVPATSTAVDNLFFFEDEIYRIDKKGRVKFGLVVETSETYSGDEDDEYDDVPGKGEIRVAWHPEGREEIQSESSVGLADRTIMPADVVRRLVPGKDTQRGYCREISMRADVRIVGTNFVIKNVVSERMRLITNWQLDTAVCLDSWVGSTKGIEETIVLKSTYGARVEVSSSGLYGFKDVNCLCSRGIFNSFSFYPGQVITGRLHSLEPIKLLTPDIPLKKNKKGKLLTGRYTVESINTESVWVHWQCKALSEDYDIKSHELQQPEPCVTGEDLKRLKRLNLFESCMQQINDRNYLKISDCDVIVKKSEWDKEQAMKFKLIQKIQKRIEEANQNMFVTNIASSASANSNNSHHYEKLKKKLHLLDTDKNIKAKKFVMKLEKKNKEQLHASGKPPVENNAPITHTTDSIAIPEVIFESKENSLSNDGWISDDSDADDDDDDVDIDVLGDDGEDGSTTTTISTCSSPTPRNSPKHLRYRSQWNKKQVGKKLKKIASSQAGVQSQWDKIPKVGTEVVTESLILYSTATVVWQDGTIESGIPSTHLYPIHHLDTHEFFPGDFVISGTEDSDVSYRDYGVIQSVDHQGRIASVKWFTTYTSADEAKPAYKGETEMSVYDLKDHPDFQYRPGIMVIRVANFVGEDATCTAGQIIDNYIDGRVKVWWVDGHISMCWPQDLFEVGQYDQTDLGGNESDDSWETESENSEFGCSSPKLTIAESHILSNIERARVAIARLEEIFHISPNLQNPEVMRKLLVVYKGCRYLDRLLNTNFFHEDQFMGLIERVRKGGTQTISERAQDRKNRLFNDTQTTPGSPNSKMQLHQTQQQQQQQQSQSQQQNCNCQAIMAVNVFKKTSAHNTSKDFIGPKVLFNLSSTPFKHKHSGSSTSVDGVIVPTITATVAHKRKTSPAAAAAIATATIQEKQDVENQQRSELKTLLTTNNFPYSNTSLTPSTSPSSILETSSPYKSNPYNVEKNQLLTSAMLNIEKAFEKTSQLKSTIVGALSSQDDSGNYSRNENCDGSSTSYTSSSDLTNVEGNSSLPYKSNEDPKSISCSSIEITEDSSPEFVCVRLCSLLKDQLVKCINEIRLKYYKEDNLNLSEVLEYVVEEEADELTAMATVEDRENVDNKATGAASGVGEVLALPKTLEADKETETAVLSSNSAASEISRQASVTSIANVPSECFQVLSTAPKTHKFHLTIFHPNNTQQYYKAVHRELRMLRSSLPPGVWVRVFEDRMDLVSVMIEGPKKTPYEDGMFFFDIQLGREYPKSPPLCHYISYCSDRLNPNLYEDGKVCVSLLGTWTGRDSEVWGPKSTLLQVIVSIQGLILVPEPYFNEAGYEKQKGSQQGKENSRMYNEMVIIKMVQATSKLLQMPPEMFRTEIMEHYKLSGMSMYERIKGWIELSKPKEDKREEDAAQGKVPPEFPLVPASRGFCLTLAGLLENFQTKLTSFSAANTSDNVIKVD